MREPSLQHTATTRNPTWAAQPNTLETGCLHSDPASDFHMNFSHVHRFRDPNWDDIPIPFKSLWRSIPRRTTDADLTTMITSDFEFLLGNSSCAHSRIIASLACVCIGHDSTYLKIPCLWTVRAGYPMFIFDILTLALKRRFLYLIRVWNGKSQIPFQVGQLYCQST